MFKGLQQKLSKANIRRTIQYCRKNGICNTFYAIWERTSQKEQKEYICTSVPKTVLDKQRKESKEWDTIKFSILVPAYETKEEYLKEMIESVITQSYENFELIIADASKSNVVYKIVQEYSDNRICYKKLKENKGISANSNEALKLAQGEYVALLDHDDVLTLDALYKFALSIKNRKEEGNQPILVYSDEDKMDGEGKNFFEPHRKEKFNLDLFLSNNYICHFTAIHADSIKKLRFREAFDGAQDYDLFLRVVGSVGENVEESILHIPEVLYHWRCHEASTAENPTSKMYAYEAGRRAVEDFCRKKGWETDVIHTKHLGFYRIIYKKGILSERNNVAAVGGPIYRNGKIVGGAMDEKSEVLYKGLQKHFSGYMHKASLQQQVEVLDITNLEVRKEFEKILSDILKLYNREDESNYKDISIEFAKKVKENGYILCYDPYFKKEGGR